MCKSYFFIVLLLFRYYFNFANSTIFHYFVVVVDVDVAKILTVSINTNFYHLKVSLFTTFN
nr:MAG TPA: hypothetical protein [Caudoviricetes sp.]